MKHIHTCHWPGCKTAVPPALWGCKPHWFAIPKPLRDLIWRTYRRDQEVTKTTTREYIDAARQVQAWIAQQTQKETTPMLPALSIRQPWAWLIVNGHKDIENREWTTTFRGRFLVHAGKTLTRAFYDETVAQLREAGLCPPDMPALEDLQRGGIVGEAEIIDCVPTSQSPWHIEGHQGFVLRNARPLPFCPWNGKLGFFNVPESAVPTATPRETASLDLA